MDDETRILVRSDWSQLTSVLREADRRALAAAVTHMSQDADRVPINADRATVTSIACEVLKPYVEGRQLLEEPDGAVLQAAMNHAAGDEVDPEYRQLVREYIGVGRPRDIPALRAPAGFSLVIIGAGVTGVLTAIALKKAGFDNFLILERSSGTGGVWRQNTYPGCKIDAPSFLYSFSFERDYEWTDFFSRQPDLLRYIERVAQKYDLARHMRTLTAVQSLTWDDSDTEWVVQTQDSAGRREEYRANFVVGATGGLRVAKLPDLPGIDSFGGQWFHSTNWDAGVDLRGKRVAVIGTGASANQIVPAIAGDATHLAVFQRSPQWMLAHPDYTKPVTPQFRHLLRGIPAYAEWYRFRQFWLLGDKAQNTLHVAPGWPKLPESVNEASAAFRAELVDYINSKLEDHPDLVDKCIPDYPPYAKRMLLDNGWFEALKQPNVELINDRIEQIVPDGVRTAGRHVPLDVIIYATGFQADGFLSPVQITGRDGENVRRRLDEDPRAYLGMAVENCPNMVLSPGPNGVPGHAGNYVFYAESQVDYIINLLKHMFDTGAVRVVVKPKAVDSFVESVDRAAADSVWTLPGVSNWYRGARDRVTAVLPMRVIDFWRFNRFLRTDDYLWT